MKLGIVCGTITSTVNHPFYDGRKLLMVQFVDGDFEPDGGYLIAIDTVSAGMGDQVLVLDEGTGARQVLDAASGSSKGPVRSVIVGIVDRCTYVR